MFQTDTGKKCYELRRGGKGARINSINFSPDSSKLCVSRWDTLDGPEIDATVMMGSFALVAGCSPLFWGFLFSLLFAPPMGSFAAIPTPCTYFTWMLKKRPPSPAWVQKTFCPNISTPHGALPSSPSYPPPVFAPFLPTVQL